MINDRRPPPLGVRYRRALRQFGQAAAPIRVLTLAVALVLVADLIGLGGIGGSSSSSNGGLASNGANGGANGGALGTTPGGGPGTTPGGGPSNTPGGTGPGAIGPGATITSGLTGSGAQGTTGTTTKGQSHLTASDRGVTSNSITVVFPWPNLGPIGQATGLDTSSEDPVLSIHTYVNDVNAKGGINGRMINPEIVSYNPLDDADMRAKCIQWTQDQQVFAVVDTIGWHDANQLCITQEGHMPLISGWTAVPLFTQEGNPNLWWTGPDNALVVQNLVHWAVGRGMLTPQTKFGVIAADRQEDVIALHQYLEPALKAAGLQAADTESMHFDSTDGTDSSAQAPGIVARLRAKGVTTVLPLLPFFNLSAFMTAAQNQKWDPIELMSDYESGLTAGLGLADAGYGDADNQIGPTSFILGNSNDQRGYSPLELDCYNVWMKANPGVTPPPHHHVESTGTAMTYCQNIRLFAKAATMAGPNLTRMGFDSAMSQITHFPGTVVPDLAFGPSTRAGPHQYRTVQIHENGDKKCPKLADGNDQGSCWLILDPGFSEMRA